MLFRSFTLPREQVLHLSVLDVQGRECAVLADGAYPAGHHRVATSAAAHGPLAPGLYWLRLRTEDGTLSHRFVIME